MDSDAYTEVDAYMEVDADMDVDADMNMDADTDMYTDLRVDADANMDTDNDTFVDWDLAIKHIKKHDIENGFEVVKHRLQKNKRNEVVHHTFECKKSHKYYPQKKANMKDNCEHESMKINCPWKVNIYLYKGSKFQCLSSEMLEEVKFLTNIGCGIECFPDAVIHPKNVYNAICHFRHNKNLIKTNAAVTYEKLMQLQHEEHWWFIDVRLEGEDNHLTSLFWMRPSQIDLWRRFHD
ncbi:12192_t:CDS:2, partial [Cetraspora pellucida]